MEFCLFFLWPKSEELLEAVGETSRVCGLLEFSTSIPVKEVEKWITGS